MVNLRCWRTRVKAPRAMTMVSDVPLESVHEQVSKERSPGNGLAEGAVKELKAKIRTLRHSTEMGLGRRIPETHDSLGMVGNACCSHDQLIGSGQGSMGRHRVSCVWDASFAEW